MLIDNICVRCFGDGGELTRQVRGNETQRGAGLRSGSAASTHRRQGWAGRHAARTRPRDGRIPRAGQRL
jgi:hypothetical protein